MRITLLALLSSLAIPAISEARPKSWELSGTAGLDYYNGPYDGSRARIGCCCWPSRPLVSPSVLQRTLYRRGYYAGPIDGIIGPDTRRAIACFEASQGLRVRGYVTGYLLDVLGLR